MSYLVGIDIGGTFTDCAIVDRAGKLLTTKVPSTPGDFSRGMMDALGAGAQALGLELGRFCRDIAFLSHGTTVGTNTIIQKKGAKVGLITTRGHEDAIHIMRGSRGYGGRDIRKVVHFPETAKPSPIVPKRLIRGVSERVDCFGAIVSPLNEAEAERAVRELLDRYRTQVGRVRARRGDCIQRLSRPHHVGISATSRSRARRARLPQQ